jgi:hypothetical protein
MILIHWGKKQMWYKIAAFGTIDLQKYLTEDLGEDFDVEKELLDLLNSGIDNSGKIFFNVLNDNLLKSKLKKYISIFIPSDSPGTLASYNRRTKQLKLQNLEFGQTIYDLAQNIKHELRHAVDKGANFRPKWISNIEIRLATNFFYKLKNILVDPETDELKYDQEKIIFLMVFDLMRETKPSFTQLTGDIQKIIVDKTIADNIKRPDQVYEVFQRLAKGESPKDISTHYNVNNPQEYTTFLSDLDDLFSPQAFVNYVSQFSSTDQEKFINELRNALSIMSQSSVYKIINNISAEGANLLVNVLLFTENEQMKKNAYKIINKNFQEFLSQYNLEKPDQFKEAKKDYNAPRTGKKKKRWSVKYKKSINCNSPKGFSQINYCKRKRSGGKYKTEG